MTDRLKALYTRYAPLVYRRCRSILKNDDEAWDGVQEVFLQLAERHTLVERMASPTSYLWRMATNYSLNRLKREGRNLSPPDSEHHDQTAPGEDDHIRTLFLDRLFAQVSGRTRELAWYRWVDGMTWEETAEASGLSVSGVRKHLSKFADYAARYKEHVS